jgi:hypothetical protein
MKIRLASIEARLQALIEGSLQRIFPGEWSQANLANLLVEAMQSGIRDGEAEELIAPNYFTLIVHDEDAIPLQQRTVLLNGLTHCLVEAGLDAGIQFNGPVVLRVVGENEVARGDLRVEAAFSEANIPPTSSFEAISAVENQVFSGEAFLIVNGTQVFTINQPVTNIGRREDNQLVIDDPRISRLHAQLRFIKGRYVIFDLESTGGTFVNNKRIHQWSLSPGDVISLSGIPLVFGEEGQEIEDTKGFEFQA